MPMHMIYALDADMYLDKAEYIFEFEGRKFRLVRGPEGETDKLCVIIQDPCDKNEEREVFESVLKLFDRLSWMWRVGIYCSSGGGFGFRENSLNFETAKINCFCKRNLRSLITNLSTLPDVQNETQDFALSLWNEGSYAQSPFLKFICFWRILELSPDNKKCKGNPSLRAVNWINSVSYSRVYPGEELVKIIQTEKIKIGNFLYEQCRNAIAHVTRKPTMKPYKQEDRFKIQLAAYCVRDYAVYYMRTCLDLGGYGKPIKIIKTKEKSKAHSLLSKQVKRRIRLSAPT